MEGMRVIRLESPPRGDPNRWVGRDALPGAEPGMQIYFLPNNLGKQAITLNWGLRGRALLRAWCASCRSTFSPRTSARAPARLGIDYETLRAPADLIAGITGRPGRRQAADPILQARAGFMDLTGEPGPPTVFGLPMVDLGAANTPTASDARALPARSLGEGAHRRPMFQSAVSWIPP
jgi:CoA:oxalate CoA-transferase